MENRSK